MSPWTVLKSLLAAWWFWSNYTKPHIPDHYLFCYLTNGEIHVHRPRSHSISRAKAIFGWERGLDYTWTSEVRYDTRKGLWWVVAAYNTYNFYTISTRIEHLSVDLSTIYSQILVFCCHVWYRFSPRDDPTCAISILVSEMPVSVHKAFNNSNPKRQSSSILCQNSLPGD